MSEPSRYPCEPVWLDDDGTPVFSSSQLEVFGPPEYYHIMPYRVVESRETTYPLAWDYVSEMEAKSNVRPIHRYCRRLRFRATLLQLLGERGDNIPPAILTACSHLNPQDTRIWLLIRAVLKSQNTLRTYQNSIPTIIRKLGGPPVIQWDWEQFQEVMSDFCRLSVKFDAERGQPGKRKYFPSLRFMALKLLKIAGVKMNVQIPLAVVARKVREMEEWWYEFYD